MATRSLLEKVLAWKKRRRALILVHNYQLPELYDIADYIGDSLGLSRQAGEAEDADVIVFCGVHFMAETAAVLNPDKTVLLPDPEAGCPMADMITGADLRAWKAEHPGAVVVCYVNSTAEVKAESDCCCTSANAVDVVASFPADQEILFVPDRHLGEYAAQQSGRELLLWPGYCPVHVKILPEDIVRLRTEHPDAAVMVHPECPSPVRALADEVLSTGGMLRFARESSHTSFIVGTEIGMCERLRRECPGKQFHPVPDRCRCPNMKKNHLGKVLWALQNLAPRITVPEQIRTRAEAAVRCMLELG